MLNISSVLVTGANRGIGLEFFRQLASLEPKISHVIATCRNPDSAEELKAISDAHDNVHIVKLDVINYDSYDTFYSEIEKIVGDSGLDILINNAGIAIKADLDEVEPENFIENFNVNTVGTYILTRKLTPLIKLSQRKLIVTISTTVGSITSTSASIFGFPAYKASKAALNMVTRTYADQVKKDGIISVIFCPGWCKTDQGGPNAMLEVDFSVSNMIKTISTLNQESSGTFIDYEGKTVPW